MDVRIVFFLFVVKCAVSDIPSPRGYYGKSFLDFSIKMRPKNVILESIFDNLDAIKNSSRVCHRHLETYQNSLNNNSFWAMNYLDSSGGFAEPGWLTGNVVNLGAFDECISQTGGGFQSNYCWLRIQLPADISQYDQNNNPIVFSLCLPNSCSKEDIITLTRSEAIKNDFSVLPFCQGTRPSMSTIDYIAIFFFSIIGLITVLTTLPMEWIPIQSKRILDFWGCFDLSKNMNTLYPSKGSENVLGCLFGIRFLSQCCIVWVHVIVSETKKFYPIQNKFTFNEIYRMWLDKLALSVDAFIVMGGTVLAYNCLKRKTELNLLKYYFHRYIRLTPLVIAMIVIVGTFSNKMCSGPLCPTQSDVSKDNCENRWWITLLYINNWLGNEETNCLPHAWYLGVDMQLYMFLSPFVVIVINKKPQHIYKLIAAIFIMSIIYSMGVLVLIDAPVNFTFLESEGNNIYLRYHYMSPFVRAGPWSIGLLLGVVLHYYDKRSIKWAKSTLIICWIACALLLYSTSILQNTFYFKNPDLYRWVYATYLTFNHNGFALALAWIVFACSMNIAGPIGKFLTAPIFVPLGKLSYAMYLVHLNIIFLFTDDVRTSSYFSSLHVVTIVLGIILLTTGASLLLYLTIEAPFLNMEKIIFRKGNTRQTSSTWLITTNTNQTVPSTATQQTTIS